jgi:hypothetical protein
VPTHATFPMSRTFKITGDRFSIPKSGASKDWSVTVYDLSGKLVKTMTTNREIIDLRKDMGAAKGAYIVRVKAVSKW